MKLADVDQSKLSSVLERLARSVEELVDTGLTAASDTTRQTLAVSFQEASRMGLLRLGSTLRVTNEELGRYTRNEPDFSRERFAFFLNRTWLLTQGLQRALKERDEEMFGRFVWVPSGKVVEGLDLVVLGVGKKVAQNAFCAFEFRMRAVNDTASAVGASKGTPFTWSCVFPMKAGADVPAEGYLHLPQKQKFLPAHLLEHKVAHFKNIGIATDGAMSRITLNDQSTVTTGEAYKDWSTFEWTPADALRRVALHEPSPLDLDVEMQEDVLLPKWTLNLDKKPEKYVLQFMSGHLTFETFLPESATNDSLVSELKKVASAKTNHPLFGVMHYERCRLSLQPMSVLTEKGPQYLQISPDKIDRAVLLKALKLV